MRHFRNAAAVLALAAGLAGAAHAGQPDWIPEPIRLPDNYEVVSDRTIGTGTHLFQVEVAEDPAPMLETWAQDLNDNGYETDTRMMSDNRLLFSGPAGVEGQIAVTQPMDVDGYMIQIDLSGGS
ncbi:hypothetical protein [Oceaniglobus roseus]|uniref:hypothetical protein n=1 Tax=Oceaniglobus roseus TaxID=1737570 RepID=UPI000C7EE274|nr:hypothetical protein [Kandeliimicrobium roseum]